MNDSLQSSCKDIVLVHGLYQNSLVMKLLGRRLNALGYKTHYFHYPTLKQDLSHNTSALKAYLREFKQPFVIIGHSLGCILTLNTLHQESFPLLQSVIAITPPFLGSRIVKYLLEHQSGFLIGKAQNALTPKDDSLSWDFSIPLGIIAGTQNTGPSALLLESLTNTIEKDSMISDGTVYLDETRIKGFTDFITLPKSHTMILFDPTLPQLCDHFIQHHHFHSIVDLV